MNCRVRRSVFVVFVVVPGLSVAWGVLASQSGALPGRPASPEVAAAIRAGQQQRGPCSWNPADPYCSADNRSAACTEDPETGACTVYTGTTGGGAICGSCTGMPDATCDDIETSYICVLYDDTCCQVQQVCQTVYHTPTIEDPLPSHCVCTGSAGQPSLIGQRVNCRADFPPGS